MDYRPQTINFGPLDLWADPHFREERVAARVGEQLRLRLTVHNPGHEARRVSLDVTGPAARFSRMPSWVTVPARGEWSDDVVFLAGETEPPAGADTWLKVTVRHDGCIAGTATARIEVEPLARLSLSVTRTTKRLTPAVLEAAVEVTNVGNIALRRVQVGARDAASSPGGRRLGISQQVLDLAIGQTEMAVVTVSRPFLGWRASRVALLAHGDGVEIDGPLLRTPPLMRAPAVVAGCLALLVGVAAALLPGLGAAKEDAGGTPVVTMPSGGLVLAPPVDLVLDRPVGDDTERRPVLVDRNGDRTILPAGGAVEVAVKVPSGWLIKRRDMSGGRVLLLARDGDEQEPMRLADGPRLLFWVDGAGERVVIDQRQGQDEHVELLSLKTNDRQRWILPARTSIVDWMGRALLVRVAVASGSSHLDYWYPDRRYEPEPGRTGDSVLGVVDENLVVTRSNEGGQQCFAHVTLKTGFAPVRQPRCDLPVKLDSKRLASAWSGLSPDGSTVALPGVDGKLYLGTRDDLLDDGLPVAADGVAGEFVDLEWRTQSSISALVNDRAEILTCDVPTAKCASSPAPAADGLSVTDLVARLPLT
ncbi:hypothetical protein [Micromonospora sp. NPDC005707]|uniref:COG1470 family protein n=1 Tax=Micromonospora sp. NPDC005707 TaxID=3157050 RepID=UPI0033DD50DB